MGYAKKDAEWEALRQSYLLSEEDFNEVLGRIREVVFNGKTASKRPTLRFVIGQTGGGKSGLSALAERLNPNFVKIDSDNYKQYRRDSKEIAEKYPTKYGFLTWQDSYKHRDVLFAEALDRNYDILMETAPATGKGIHFDLSTIPPHYRIEFDFLAVSDLNSLLSTRERFEMQIASGWQTPKLTDVPRHDDSFAMMRTVIADPQYADIPKRIFIRGKEGEMLPQLVYSTEEENEEAPLDSLIRYQTEDLEATLEEFPDRYDLIKTQMTERNAPLDQFDSLQDIHSRYEARLEEMHKPN